MSSKGFGFVIAVTFTLNYIIGTGFLTLPWAFYESGDVLATCVLLFITLLAACSALMILEAMARAEAVVSSKQRVNSFRGYNSIPTSSDAADDDDNNNNTLDQNEKGNQQQQQQEEGSDGAGDGHGDDYDSGALWLVGERRIEIVELCERFYPSGRPYFVLILSIYLYGALWAYATVFANALTTTSPLFGEEYSYYCYVFIYALVVVPMSCLELHEQVNIQIFYAACRVAMVVAMLGTVVYAVCETGATYSDAENDYGLDHDYDSSPPADIQSLHSSSSSSSSGSSYQYSNGTTDGMLADLVKWSGFKIIVPIALYSNIFHHSLPALSEIASDKKQLGMVYISTLMICFGAYTIIGVTLSTYFGSHVLSSSNLNWADFYHKHENMIVKIISNYIILFPAVDVMSAFPLSAITLGNNIHAFSTPSIIHTEADEEKKEEGGGGGTAGTGGGLSSTRREVIWYRCVGSIPPILGACLVKDLGVITKYTGITGFAIIFFYPVLLSYLSECALQERGLSPQTYYSCALTSDGCKVMLVVFGIFMVFLTIFT